MLAVRFRVPAFIATLGSLYALRGFTLYLTQTRAMNLPESILRLADTSILGIPTPVWLVAAVILAVEVALRATAWGRQIYAVGYSPEQARRAGLDVSSLLASAYLLSGLLAALGGLLSVAQLGAVSPTFGNGREFAAIAAAVLGGTSLFGGRGNVFPGTIVGALLIQTVETGLVMLNANPYLYPIVMASVIFAAVLLDSLQRSGSDARCAGPFARWPMPGGGEEGGDHTMSRTSEIALAAGQLSAIYHEGSLRYIRYAGVEILRRIYFAIRDRDWRTIPGRVEREDVSFDREGFAVRFDVVHSEPPIDFRWTGRIRGSGNRIEFSAEGQARGRDS